MSDENDHGRFDEESLDIFELARMETGKKNRGRRSGCPRRTLTACTTPS